MKTWKLHKAVLLASITYYAGLISMLGLKIVDGSTARCRVPFFVVLLGLLLSAIPDMAINVDVKGISLAIFRSELCLKIAMLAVAYYWIDNSHDIALYIMICLVIVDWVLSFILLNEIQKADISFEQFLKRVVEPGNPESDSVYKYVTYNILNLAVYANMQSSIMEIAIFSVLCVLVHGYIAKNIVDNLENSIDDLNSRVINVALWGIHIVAMVFAIIQIKLPVYVLSGLYWMVVTDIATPKNTSIFKRK